MLLSLKACLWPRPRPDCRSIYSTIYVPFHRGIVLWHQERNHKPAKYSTKTNIPANQTQNISQQPRKWNKKDAKILNKIIKSNQKISLCKGQSHSLARGKYLSGYKWNIKIKVDWQDRLVRQYKKEVDKSPRNKVRPKSNPGIFKSILR